MVGTRGLNDNHAAAHSYHAANVDFRTRKNARAGASFMVALGFASVHVRARYPAPVPLIHHDRAESP
jgi:hypothetical protein